MYLRQLHIQNNGPLREIHLELPFTAAGTPKPVVLVGGNGSGKTNLISIVADALITAAGNYYTDVLAGMSAANRPWFRVVGGRTVSVGASGGFTIMEFEHEGATYVFKEKAGRVPPAEAAACLPESLRPAASWKEAENKNVKELRIESEQARRIFDEGVYVYFPSSRAEAPHWLNLESVPTAEFELGARFANRLQKPIYLEKALERFQQWLLAVMMEARCDVDVFQQILEGGLQSPPRSMHALAYSHRSNATLDLANQILRKVLRDKGADFVWLGRRHPEKLGIAVHGDVKLATLGGLSAGQSTLLGIFGTILRYGDHGKRGGRLPPDEIAGICAVDEIDAHMHVGLQHCALPELIRFFPRMQFIVSSHSPLFVLGMEKMFGADGITIIDMPSGTPIQAEAYTEFERALQVLHETKAFAAAIETAAGTPGKPLVLLEGETDPIYLQTAADLLGRQDLLDKVDFEWVGAKDPKGGQAVHTGKDALNLTLKVLSAKPQLVQRHLILLYDNDVNKPDDDRGNLHVRSMPSNPANNVVEDGIENLLPPGSITEDMFDLEQKKARNGKKITTEILNKMRLCTHVCRDKRDPTDFAAFAAVLDLVEQIVDPAAAAEAMPADAEKADETAVLGEG